MQTIVVDVPDGVVTDALQLPDGKSYPVIDGQCVVPAIYIAPLLAGGWTIAAEVDLAAAVAQLQVDVAALQLAVAALQPQ